MRWNVSEHRSSVDAALRTEVQHLTRRVEDLEWLVQRLAVRRWRLMPDELRRLRRQNAKTGKKDTK